MNPQMGQQNSPAITRTDKCGGFGAALRERPGVFVGVWLALFGGLLALCFAVGLVPNLDASEDEGDTVAEATTTQKNITEENSEPLRIVIDTIGVDAPVENPESRDIAVLDAALTEGVVRYPGSGDLEDISNMFLFGHSSGLRVVNNQMFKVFNGLKELEKNDIIRVRSASKEYVYRVRGVTLTTADNAFVEFSSSKKMLTLSTCNSFGAKQERYVVEADFVGAYEL